MLLHSCNLALWTACCLFWRQSGDQANANLVGRSGPKPRSPLGCPRAWRCLLQEVPSGAPPDLCECAPCTVSEGNEIHTTSNRNPVVNVYFVTFIFEPSFRPEPDARRRGNKIIVSISAALKRKKNSAMWQMDILKHDCYNMAWEKDTEWVRKLIFCKIRYLRVTGGWWNDLVTKDKVGWGKIRHVNWPQKQRYGRLVHSDNIERV